MMYERGHIVACDVTFSIRLDANRILPQPRLLVMNTGMMSPRDLSLDGMAGTCKATGISSAAGMHLFLSDAFPTCQGGFATHIRLGDWFFWRRVWDWTQALLCPRCCFSLGKFPCALRYAGQPDLALVLEPYVRIYMALPLSIMAGHLRPRSQTAFFFRMEPLEHFSPISSFPAKLSGEPTVANHSR